MTEQNKQVTRGTVIQRYFKEVLRVADEIGVDNDMVRQCRNFIREPFAGVSHLMKSTIVSALFKNLSPDIVSAIHQANISGMSDDHQEFALIFHNLVDLACQPSHFFESVKREDLIEFYNAAKAKHISLKNIRMYIVWLAIN